MRAKCANFVFCPCEFSLWTKIRHFSSKSSELEFRRIKLSLLLHITKVREISNESHKGRGQNSVSVESWMISDKKHTDYLTSAFSLVCVRAKPRCTESLVSPNLHNLSLSQPS